MRGWPSGWAAVLQTALGKFDSCPAYHWGLWQTVSRRSFKAVTAGSTPAGPISSVPRILVWQRAVLLRRNKSVRIAPGEPTAPSSNGRMQPSQGCDAGSAPAGATKFDGDVVIVAAQNVRNVQARVRFPASPDPRGCSSTVESLPCKQRTPVRPWPPPRGVSDSDSTAPRHGASAGLIPAPSTIPGWSIWQDGWPWTSKAGIVASTRIHSIAGSCAGRRPVSYAGSGGSDSRPSYHWPGTPKRQRGDAQTVVTWEFEAPTGHHADVVQRQDRAFPRRRRGFDPRHPLHSSAPTPAAGFYPAVLKQPEYRTRGEIPLGASSAPDPTMDVRPRLLSGWPTGVRVRVPPGAQLIAVIV